MYRRSLITRVATLGAICLVAATLQLRCDGSTPKPRKRTTPENTTGPGPQRRAVAQAEAPKGPAIDERLLVTARVGALDRLDARIAALVPPMVPKAMISHLFTKQFLPEMAGEIGLNPLALDALDLTRPSVVGLLVEPHPQEVVRVRPVALIPLRAAGKLVTDALKVSWPESTTTDWGGVRLVSGGKTVAWVRVGEQWAVVAPTAPLLDSATKALRPLARDVPEGTVVLRLRWADILALVRPAIIGGWQKLKGAAKAMGPRLGLKEAMITGLFPVIEKLGQYLDSITRVDFKLRLADQAWSWEARVKPQPEGKLANWVADLEPAGDFGLKLLSPDAVLVSVDRPSEELRQLSVKLYSAMMDFAEPKLVKELPHAVSQRGLLKKEKPVSLRRYRRALRDLNLKDYRASHGLYRLLFDLRAFRAHLQTRLAALVKLGSGEVASALYTPRGKAKAPGLGMMGVEGVRDPRAHRKQMRRLMRGNQRLLNRLLQSAWKVVPSEVKKRYGLRRLPIKAVFEPVALRVGRTRVSTFALRLRWPRPRRGKAAPRQAELTQLRRYVELLLGKGDLTYAWAYVGKQRVSAMGKGWRAQIRAALKRSRPGGGKQPSALTDPLLRRTRRAVPGDYLSRLFFSGSRLVLALLDALPAFGLPVPQRGPAAVLIRSLAAAARNARVATSLGEARERGDYVLRSVIPASDIRTLLVGTGMYLFLGARSPSKSHGASKATPPAPPAPPRRP
jgi:hypothetical protein